MQLCLICTEILSTTLTDLYGLFICLLYFVVHPRFQHSQELLLHIYEGLLLLVTS